MMQTSRSNMDLNKYVDIIEERRHTSDFMWNSRELRLTKSYKQCQETNNPYKYQDELLRSPFIQQLIQDVSRDNKISKKQAAQRVTEILNEIGHTRRLPVVRCIGMFFVKVVKKILSGVYVNEAQVLKLKSEMGKNPVIFLPSHRSYADFLLMTYISYHYEIEIPCIAAGMDFQSMWLVGKLLRDCNAFFMRRSFGDDQLYRNIFKAYVQHLVVNGDAPIEFFIEGTRSRSSKALVPKFGLLTMLLEPFFNGDVPDITLVPVSFSYERVLEEALFSYEMLGIPKPKESTSGLIKALRIMNENYGKVYTTFNQPISLRKFIKENLGSAVDFTRRDVVRENDFITNLGYHVVDCQQKNMVLNSFNLFAIVLSNHIMVDSLQPLMIESASKEVAWLSAVLSTLGASLHSITHSAAVSIVTDAIKLHESVVRLSANGSIHLATASNENCKNIDHRKLKGHKLSVDMMNLAVPLLVLQQYINPCLHFLVNPAIITVIMQQIGTTGHITKHELFKKFQFLRELLTYEFVFYKPWEIQEFEDGLTKLELVSIIESEPLRLGNHQKLQAMLCNLLYPFLSGYLSVCRLLQNINLNEWTERQLLRAAQEKIEEELCSGWLLHPYSLSLDMISSCIASLTSMNVLSRKRIGTEVRYYVIENNLISIKTELESLVIGPQKQHRKEQDCIEDPKTLHVISSSEPLQRLVSKL